MQLSLPTACLLILLPLAGAEEESELMKQLKHGPESIEHEKPATGPEKQGKPSLVNSLAGEKILAEFKHAVVARYEEGEGNLYGTSGNPDGKRIRGYANLDNEQAAELKDMCLDPNHVVREFKKIEIDKNRNHNQGFEFTNGEGFVRIYFTQDGQYCRFFSSSGEGSETYTCSKQLATFAEGLLAKMEHIDDPKSPQNIPKK